MKLHIYLHGERAATLDTGSNQLTNLETIDWTPACTHLSAAWDDAPEPIALRHWLEACLPENGARDPYERRALALKIERGEQPVIHGPVDILWGNTDAEYPGAVHFTRDDEPRTLNDAASYNPISDKEVAARLHEAWEFANRKTKGAPRRHRQRRASLSGMRGKIGLTLGRDGDWLAAEGAALNTWIAKHEDNPKHVGEAGVESIVQHTLRLLGIEAARTRAQVFADTQTVLSERADRVFDADAGRVVARHQEEFCQALGWPGSLKYDDGGDHEPRWEHAHKIIANDAAQPETEHEKLIRILAATWALGHNDLHRRNLGFSHSGPGEPYAVRIAPMYDTSSAIGLGGGGTLEMAVGIARQRAFHKVGPAQWLEHAKISDQDGEQVLAVVSATLSELPDALAQARDQARSTDENRVQHAVDLRVERMLTYLNLRQREWLESLTRMRARGARGLAPTGPEQASSDERARRTQRAVRVHGLRAGHTDIGVRTDAIKHLATLGDDTQTDQQPKQGSADANGTIEEAIAAAEAQEAKNEAQESAQHSSMRERPAAGKVKG